MHSPPVTQVGPAGPIPHWPGTIVRLGSAQVFVRAAPAPPGAQPALCVHGLGGSSANWTDLMDALRQQEPPLAAEAVDLPGSGYSPPAPDGEYTVSAQSAVVARLIEQRGNGPVHLIGNSLGGAVCTRLAAQRPDLVATLTLVSPALPDLRPRPVPARITALRVPGLGPWLIERAQRIPAGKRVAWTLRDVYFDPASVHPDRVAAEIAEVERVDGLSYAGPVLLRSAYGVISEYFRRGPGSLWRDAARVTAPVLVLYGSHDRLVDPRMAVRAARTFPRVRVLVLPRTGHVAQMEHPEVVAEEIRATICATAC